jgi:hypothetical protein
MRKRRALFIAVACVVVVAAIALFSWTAEPAYNGHLLSRCVAILAEGGHQEKTVQKAVEAVDNIGTNATPYLLAWIQFEPQPGPFRSKLANPYNWGGGRVSFRDRLLYEFRSRRERLAEGADTAFQVLGARATPAIPELTRLMNSRTAPITALRSALALARLGTNGLPALLAAIDDPEHQNRFVALKAIGMFLGSEPHLVIPVLTNCLNSTDRSIRCWSVTALGDIGGRAVVALPALTNALSDPDPRVSQQAICAIEKIAPEPPTNAPVH